jgi:hypothetical protein
MILYDLLKDLTYGEFAQLKIGNLIPGEYESEVDPTRYEQLMTAINLALKEIYKRFFLSSKEIYIQQHSEIAIYVLDSKYAQSNVASPEDPKYIMDTVDIPFEDDILKIEEVYDEGGNKLPINDITEDLSVYTPNYKSIQVPYPDDANTMAVQYRACHPQVVYTRGMDPSKVEIWLPNSLHEAFLYYVAARLMAPVSGGDGNSGVEYMQKFENSCLKVDELGLEIQAEPGDWRFDATGWV